MSVEEFPNDSEFLGEDAEPITDELGEPDPVIPYRYSISSYGADYPVDGLVKRMQSGAIYVPAFQRAFVWPLKHASRFIESLLLGLPVPGIFLSKDPDTQQLLVVDGQQRLKTLQYFYEGVYADTRREFALVGVQPQFEGATYRTLEPESQLLLDDSIIHATIIRQDEPSDDESSIYNVFERLNSGATRLTAQEIRSSIFHGSFSDLLQTLNQTEAWRTLFFRVPSKRMRDQELILRFLALYFARDNYHRPMEVFLNEFMGGNRQLQRYSAEALSRRFVPTLDAILEGIGPKAFKPQKSFNAAVFDSIMIAVAALLEQRSSVAPEHLSERYQSLLKDEEYIEATLRATADPQSVETRIQRAMMAFGVGQE